MEEEISRKISTYKDRCSIDVEGEAISAVGEPVIKADFGDTDFEDTFLKVHPNPFSQYTTIEFGVTETALTSITLYTLDGRKISEIQSSLVESGVLQTIQFEAGDILPGMYLLQLITENGEMVMEKLIVR